MSGPHQVVVGASGSPGSIRALRYAEHLARFGNVLLVPVLAWIPPGGDLAERRAPCPELRRTWEAIATQRLTEAMESAWAGPPDGLTVRPIIQRGEAGPVLVNLAACEDDLLVVGAGRRGPLRGLWGGRVTRYCLRHGQCPVLAVPPAGLSGGSGLAGWAFRHRELTLGRAVREWKRASA
jgi:nucleotide-binding universal stress UspA family protein